MVEIYLAVEESIDGIQLSDQGRASLRRYVNYNAVEAGYVYPYDKDNPGWRITPEGKRYLLKSSQPEKDTGSASDELSARHLRLLSEDLAEINLVNTTLSKRLQNILLRYDIHTIGELVRYFSVQEPPKIPSIGQMGTEEITEFLDQVYGNPSAIIPQKEDVKEMIAHHSSGYILKNGVSFANLSIRDTPLPVRVKNALGKSGIRTVEDLQRSFAYKRLYVVRNLGSQGRSQIREYLSSIGMSDNLQGYLKPERSEKYYVIEDMLQDLPTSVLVPFLSSENIPAYNCSFSSVDEVLNSIDTGSSEILISQSASISELESVLMEMSKLKPNELIGLLIEKHRNYLADQVARKLIHPRLSINGSYAAYWLQEDAKPDVTKENLKILCDLNSGTTITAEIEELISLERREVDILFRRYGRDDQTLQDVADNYSLTRERIRQIEKRAIDKLWRKFSTRPFPLLKSAFEYARDDGVDFDFRKWFQGLGSRKLIFPLPTDHLIAQLGYGLDDFLRVLIATSSKDPRGKELISTEVRDSL